MSSIALESLETGAGTTVEFADVHRVFGSTHALDGLDLKVRPGELLALLGPSGCGKTTALRLLAGFDQPDAGSVLVDGEDVSRLPANKRDMGMVFQSYSLFPTMSAVDNVAFGLRLRGRGAGDRRKRAAELLDLVGLSEHLKKFPHQMSGGQQQRVALARALAISPRVLLLDEPLSALDAKVRAQLRDEIRRIQLELGVTTVFVTHDQEEALSMADRVGVMRDGRLEQCAAPSELYQRPETPFVAEFVGTMNRLPGSMVPGGVRLFTQVVAVDGVVPPAGSDVRALLRPEAVLVEPADGQPGHAMVTTATFFGAVTRLRMTQPDGQEILADVGSHRAADFPAGAQVLISVLDRPVLVRPESESTAATVPGRA
ncbi:MAG: putative spermidine/putrescine transport system ATP-binding protein [Pseudonocardiales bacterium]|jgi:putative spermidine/putrescine transport system ATP-binding protein|nr:cysA3 [Frankiales bacterium]MDQ1692445.1 putative spermidine/putrescine transport system ATP-binding protein [Pseudonocardiales bacterium]MDQ1734816.1 putative spermidine/putrescine transport system ATP-binding protein [Pseudonocardiales bacterium]